MSWEGGERRERHGELGGGGESRERYGELGGGGRGERVERGLCVVVGV